MKPTVSPSTPLRTTRLKDPPLLIPSGSRVVQPNVPLNTFNPFSPQKKSKGKDIKQEIGYSMQAALETHSKLIGKASSRAQARTRSLSPNPFTHVNQIQPSSSSPSSAFSLNPPHMPASAVSRARKRLRGEPVSPSPSKDKRRRVIPATAISFPQLNATDSYDKQHNADTSFVDNSPLKAPFSGKLFSRLFGESSASLDNSPTISKTQEISSISIDDVTGPSIYSVVNNTKHTKEVLEKRQLSKLDANQPSLTGLTKSSESLTTLENGSILQARKAFSVNRSSTKRPFSDDEPNLTKFSRTRSPLLPPSPPPTDTLVQASTKPLQHKGISKTNKGPKKMRYDEKLDHDSDDLELAATLKIVHRKTTTHLHAVGDEGDFRLDSGPMTRYTRFPALHPSSPIADKHHCSIEVDLPDRLRSMLALQSSGSKAQVSKEDQLVKGLLYGRRVTHYDPNKGGEIWDAGEDDLGSLDEEGNRYTDREDEWECEPVPWEVGEL